MLAERQLGAGILVSTKVKPTAAAYTLRDPDQVGQFLGRLVDWGVTGAAGRQKERAGAPGLWWYHSEGGDCGALCDKVSCCLNEGVAYRRPSERIVVGWERG